MGRLTCAGRALEVVEEGVELQAAQQGQAGVALGTAGLQGEGTAEQGQCPGHVGLGQVHTDQAEH